MSSAKGKKSLFLGKNNNMHQNKLGHTAVEKLERKRLRDSVGN